MADDYYRGLAKQQQNPNTSKQQTGSQQALDPGGSSGGGGGISAVNGDTFGSNPTGTAQSAQGSPDSAGSGFVNLSHLLALNGQSGAKTAQGEASGIRTQGNSAQAALANAQNQFASQSKAGSVSSYDVENNAGDNAFGQKVQSNHQPSGTPGTNPGETPPDNQTGYGQTSIYQAAANRAHAGYTGPQDLQGALGQAGYSSLGKQLSDAQNRAQNATSGAGMAAQVSATTGLSPRQAAASAFYEGVTNQNLQGAGRQFSKLGAQLSAADQKDVNLADIARANTAQSANQLDQDVTDSNAYWNDVNNPANIAPSAQETDVADKKAATTADQTANDATAVKYKGIENSPLSPSDDTTYAIGQGEDPQLAQVLDYDDWVAQGRPSYDDYEKKIKGT